MANWRKRVKGTERQIGRPFRVSDSFGKHGGDWVYNYRWFTTKRGQQIGVSDETGEVVAPSWYKDRDCKTNPKLCPVCCRGMVKSISGTDVVCRVHGNREQINEYLESIKSTKKLDKVTTKKDVESDLKEIVNGSKTFEEFVKKAEKYFNVDKPASEAQISDYIIARSPYDDSYLSRRPWYGTERLDQYNDARVSGRVIKFNPKSIVIKNEDKGEWNYGHTYKIPKNARVTEDITFLRGKTEDFFKGFYEKQKGVS